MKNLWYKINNTTIDMRSDIDYLDLLPAAKITIEDIMTNYEPPYYLMLSGGLDSQAMLDLWLRYGSNFIPTHVRYNYDLNMHDFRYLQAYAKNKIEINVIDFNIIDFFENKYLEYANSIKAISPHFAAHLYFSQNLKGTIIFSGDRIDKYNGMNQILAMPVVSILSTNMCLFEQSNIRSIVPSFFIHTPQLAYSIIYDKKYLKCIPSNGYHTYKYKLLSYEGLRLIKPDLKYTGFEKVKDYYDINHSVDKKTILRYRNKPSRRSFDLILRYPLEEKFGVKKYEYLFNNLF